MTANIPLRLRKLGRAVTRSVKYVNHGGCCVLASMVGRRLTDLGVEVEGKSGRIWCDEPCNLNMLRWEVGPNWRKMREWWSKGADFNHMWLEVGMPNGTPLWWDSTTLCRPDKTFTIYTANIGTHPISELERMAADREGWNSTYSRDTYNPVLRQLIDTHLPLDIR